LIWTCIFYTKPKNKLQTAIFQCPKNWVVLLWNYFIPNDSLCGEVLSKRHCTHRLDIQCNSATFTMLTPDMSPTCGCNYFWKVNHHINWRLNLWHQKLTIVDAQCHAEKTKHPIKLSAKNIQSNTWPFQSRVFQWETVGTWFQHHSVKEHRLVSQLDNVQDDFKLRQLIAPYTHFIYLSLTLQHTGYGLDGPRIESQRGVRFSAPVQTGPGAHPASCTMGTGSFPGVNSGQGTMLTPHVLQVS